MVCSRLQVFHVPCDLTFEALLLLMPSNSPCRRRTVSEREVSPSIVLDMAAEAVRIVIF